MNSPKLQSQIASRLSSFWSSNHPLTITDAVAMVADKLPTEFQELSTCQRETDSIALLSTALVKLGHVGIADGQIAGDCKHPLHKQVSTIHQPA